MEKYFLLSGRISVLFFFSVSFFCGVFSFVRSLVASTEFSTCEVNVNLQWAYTCIYLWSPAVPFFSFSFTTIAYRSLVRPISLLSVVSLAWLESKQIVVVNGKEATNRKTDVIARQTLTKILLTKIILTFCLNAVCDGQKTAERQVILGNWNNNFNFLTVSIIFFFSFHTLDLNFFLPIFAHTKLQSFLSLDSKNTTETG